MPPITRDVANGYDGPTVACPSCDARIAITPPTGWAVAHRRTVQTVVQAPQHREFV